MVIRSSAADLARSFATGSDDPITACERALRAASRHPHVFIRLMPDRARSEALASAERWRAGKPLSPLDGVPVAWKDLFDIAGTVTTAGSMLRRSSPPASADAALVQRLTAAGLVSIGKTNLTEFALSGLGLNPHFGTPVDSSRRPARAPGGSSSGSALAVALGIVPLAIGTDTSGSIRIPAAFNGLVGFKASGQRYDATGVFPLAPSLDSIGFLTNTVTDLLLIEAIAFGMPSAPCASAKPPTLVVPQGIMLSGLDATVRMGFERSLASLDRLGWTIFHREMPSIEAADALLQRHGQLVIAEAAVVHRDLIERGELGQIDRRVAMRLQRGAAMSATSVRSLYDGRDHLLGRFAEELGNAVLVTPTVSHPAPELSSLESDDEIFSHANTQTLRNTMLLSLLDAPGLNLPMTMLADIPPAGILFSASRGQDARILELPWDKTSNEWRGSA